MRIKITADSVCDLTNELIEKYDIGILPLVTVLGDNEYEDGVTVNSTDLINYYKNEKKLPKTAARGVDVYEEFFKNSIKGYDALIHINLSSELSLSHANAVAAASSIKNVYAIDSRSLSTGVGLLVVYVAELANQNVAPQKIVEKVQKRIPHVQASFIVNTLEWLHKGGRCSSIAYLGANILGIKPCIEVKDGKMGVARKPMGKYDKVVFKYVTDTLKKYPCPDKTIAFVTHTPFTNPELATAVVDYVKSLGIFENVYETVAGATITSHCGPDTLGILYINDGEHLPDSVLNNL